MPSSLLWDALVVPGLNTVVTPFLRLTVLPPRSFLASRILEPRPIPPCVRHFLRRVIVSDPSWKLVPARIIIPQTLPFFSRSAVPSGGKSFGLVESQAHVS